MRKITLLLMLLLVCLSLMVAIGPTTTAFGERVTACSNGLDDDGDGLVDGDDPGCNGRGDGSEEDRVPDRP